MKSNIHELGEGLSEPLTPTLRERAGKFLGAMWQTIAGEHSHSHAHHGHMPSFPGDSSAGINICGGSDFRGLEAAVQAHNDRMVSVQAESVTTDSIISG